MFIIAGTKWKYNKKRDGRKIIQICPNCKMDGEFCEVVPTRYITLYFIPLIPIGSEKEPHFECPNCRKVFKFSN